MIIKYFLLLIETICCDPSSEPSLQDCSDENSLEEIDGSDERSQHLFFKLN